jgi:hypothetical protein
MEEKAQRKRGRPSEEYRKKHQVLEKRIRRAGLQLHGGNFKKQMLEIVQNEQQTLSTTIAAKEKEIIKLREKLQSMENKALFPALKALSNCSRSYAVKCDRKKRLLRKFVWRAVTSNSTAPVRDKALFIRDMIMYGASKKEILSVLQHCFETKKLATVIEQSIVHPATVSASKNDTNRARDFVDRKRLQISRRKKNLQRKCSERLQVKISPNLKIKNVGIPCSSKTDKAARAFIRNNFPYQLPTASSNIFIDVENAFVETESLVKSVLTLFYSAQQLEKHWHWFYCSET